MLFVIQVSIRVDRLENNVVAMKGLSGLVCLDGTPENETQNAIVIAERTS